jgi:hypothetical protein
MLTLLWVLRVAMIVCRERGVNNVWVVVVYECDDDVEEWIKWSRWY